VLTHGGSGTVMAALTHGLPMVIVPIMADQPENAERCAALGVAQVIPLVARQSSFDDLPYCCDAFPPALAQAAR